MMPRILTVTLLVGALVFLSAHARASTSPSVAGVQDDQALVHAANQLDAAAAAGRRARGSVRVPDLRLSHEPASRPSADQPSLDRWLQSELNQIRKEKSAKTRSSMLTELAASLRRAAQPRAAHSPARDPHDEAAAILAQRAYQTGGAGPAPAPHESILEKILRWLGDRVSELFARIFGATASNPILGRMLSIVFIALLAGLIAYLIFVLVSIVIRRRRPAASNEGTPLQERVEPDALYELSIAAAGQGLYTRAVALLFRASLASLDRAGVLPYDESLTAGEYRYAVRRVLSAASPYFDDIARAFVLAAFAERPVAKDDFSAADAAYRSLRPLLGS